MSNARRGKIARLPHAVRAELNQRLRDGAVGTELLAWLNALPEVQTVLREQFDGRPVNDQNLSDWRHGGYEEWLAKSADYEEARKTTEHAQYICSALGLDPSDALSVIVTGHLVRLLNGDASTDDVAKLGPILSAVTRRDQIALAREKWEEQKRRNAEAAAKLSAVAAQGGISPENLKRIEEAIALL
jgi:hypothetical protein